MRNMPNFDKNGNSAAVSEQERFVLGQNPFELTIFGTVTPKGDNYVDTMSANQLEYGKSGCSISASEEQICGFAVLPTDDEFAAMLCKAAALFGLTRLAAVRILRTARDAAAMAAIDKSASS